MSKQTYLNLYFKYNTKQIQTTAYTRTTPKDSWIDFMEWKQGFTILYYIFCGYFRITNVEGRCRRN